MGKKTKKWGMVIDQRKCVGCHTCTVACKSEINVPLGYWRSWVKGIQKGTYPNVKNFLGVDGFETGIGLPTDFVVQIISQVGNYEEIYNRNLIPIGLPLAIIKMTRPITEHTAEPPASSSRKRSFLPP